MLNSKIITFKKSDFRKFCIKRLRFYSKITKIKRDRVILKKLNKIIKELKPKSILLYIPLSIEVDIRVLINNLRKQKKINIYVPFMQGDSFRAVPYRLPLKRKKFGIKESNFSTFIRKIDLAIVPIVGIDSTYRRIGFGKGMYDRFFGNLKYKPIIVFTQLYLCKTDEILTSNYDIKANYIVSS